MTLTGPVPASASDNETIALARRIFAAQREHHPVLAATTAPARKERLRRLKRALLEQRDEAFAALHQDFRKHPAETELSELQPVLVELNHALHHLADWMRPRPVPGSLLLLGTHSRTEYVPRGVVLILAPWNYPLALVLIPLIAAVAAGNCVMIRPSEKVPATAAFLRRLVERTFPPEEVAVVTGGIPLAEALLELPFDHFFFTGSTAVGRKVMAAAARHLASVTLELGGKSPAIVDASADLGLAAERVVWGKFMNAGQTCIAPDFVLVEATVAEQFAAAARRAAERLYGTTPEARRKETSLCRLIDDAAFRRIDGLLRDAVARGATVAAGGETAAAERYIAPTILTGVTPEMEIMREEIFGPVLPVVAWRSPDELWPLVRRHGHPLALYVFSRNEQFVSQVAQRVSMGGMAVNTTVLQYANPGLPFGGVGESGVGQYHGEYGFQAFSHPRAVLRQGRLNLARFFFPPFTDRIRRLMRFVTERVIG